jgi:iron complex outermembrane receptor protein
LSSVEIRLALALLSGLLGLAAWGPQPARAQEPEAPEPEAPAVRPSGGIEEITITSQGREQTAQEAAISVAAFSSEYLEALGAQDIADVSQFTPNLEIRSIFAASTPTLFIRGVGLRDFNANSASSVAVYNDDVYMNSPAGQLGQFFDLEQVEILRGPQGALYGRNASAGAIRVISRKPTGEFNGFVNASYGRFDQIDLEGALEAPLVPDLLSMRVSGIMHRRDGTADNRCADDKYWRSAQASELESFDWRVFSACFNDHTRDFLGWDAGAPFPDNRVGLEITSAEDAVVPPGIAKKVNDVDSWAGRGLLRLQPSGGSDWIVNVHGGRNRGLARQFQMMAFKIIPSTGELLLATTDLDQYTDPDTTHFKPPPDEDDRCFFPVDPCASTEPEDGDVFAGDYNRTGKERIDLLGANLSGEIPIGNGDLSFRSITAYEWNERLVLSNVDANPFIGLEVDFENESWQASQELKAFWDAGGSWSWQAGLSFLYEELEVLNDFHFLPEVTSRQDYTQQTYYGSAYGYFAWLPADELSVEGGLRWNVEHKDFEITAFQFGITTPETVTQFAEATEQAPSGDISVHYRPYEDVNFYAKFSRGWKGPHFNGNVITTLGALGQELVEPVKPENVNGLELGLKSMWLDSRLRLNTAAFYYDFENIQIFQVRNTASGIPVQELINASDADVYGIEVEVEGQPFQGYDWAAGYLEGLTLFGAFAWLESRYTDFVQKRVEIVTATPVVRTDDFSGNRLINAPRLAFAGYVLWDWTLGRYGGLTPRLDWSFKDRVFFSPDNIEPASQDALWLLNARLAYRTPDETIELAGWVRNLTDEVYRLDVIDLSRFQRSILYAMGDPRTYGISLSVSF